MSFGKQIRQYAEKQKKNVKDVAVKSLVDLSASVIVKTPVLDGILANSWIGSVGEPSQEVATSGDNSGQLERVELAVNASIGGLFYLVNNQPYAHRIEFEGYSEKAPAGMLRISIENYQQYLDNAISQLP